MPSMMLISFSNDTCGFVGPPLSQMFASFSVARSLFLQKCVNLGFWQVSLPVVKKSLALYIDILINSFSGSLEKLLQTTDSESSSNDIDDLLRQSFKLLLLDLSAFSEMALLHLLADQNASYKGFVAFLRRNQAICTLSSRGHFVGMLKSLMLVLFPNQIVPKSYSLSVHSSWV